MGRWSERPRSAAKQPIVYRLARLPNLIGQIDKYLARIVPEFYGLGAPAADFRLKNGLCSAENQRGNGELHERGAATNSVRSLSI